MSSRINSKVRRVRCPKCRRVLNEPEGVALYECGGCNTVLQAKKKKKDTPYTELPVHEADTKHKRNLENTSENPMTDYESSTDTMPERVDSVIDDKRQWLGGVNQSLHLPTSYAITEASSLQVRAPIDGEEGKLPSYQFDIEDHNKFRDDGRESFKSASSEIFLPLELNQHESKSLVPTFQKYENELFWSSPEKGTESRDSSGCNSSGEKQGTESDLENASQNLSPEKGTESQDLPEDSSVRGKRGFANDPNNVSEIPSPEKETEIRHPSEDNCEGGKQESENDEKSASEVPSTDEVESVKVIGRGESIVDGKSVISINQSHHLPCIDAISGDEITGLSVEDMGVNEGNFYLDQYGREAHSKSKNDDKEQSDDISAQYDSKAHNKFGYDDKVQSISIPNEALLSPKLSPPQNHSRLPGPQIHETNEPLMALPKKMSGSQYSSANNIDGGEKESESPQHESSINTFFSKEVSSSHLCTSNEEGGRTQVEELDENMESLSISISASKETMSETVPHSESVKIASSKIFTSLELNHHETNLLVPQSQKYDDELFFSSPEEGTTSLHSLEYNSDGGKQGSESDLENASQNLSPDKVTKIRDLSDDYCVGEKRKSENDLDNVSEIRSPEKETEIRHPSEDNSDRGKRESENDDKNASQIPSTEEADLEEVLVRGGSSADGRKVSSVTQSNHVPCLDAISSHEIEVDDKVQSGNISISDEGLSSPKLSPPKNHSRLPETQVYESNEALMVLPRKGSGSRKSTPDNIDGGKNEYESSQHELSNIILFSKEVSSSHECTSDENGDPTQVEEVDENMESLPISVSTSAETLLNSVPKDHISSESISLDNFMSHRELMKQADSGIVLGFQRVNSDDTLENMPRIYTKRDLGVKLRSPTAINYYASDGGASSSYETDDQVPHRRFHISKKNLKDGGPSSTKVLPKRGEFMVNHSMSSNSELQREPMNSASILEGNNHLITKGSRLHQGELLEAYRHPVQYTTRDARTEYKSRVPFSKSGPQADYRNSDSSSYGLTDYNAMPDDPHELHRLELLNMVYELQDQLKRVQMSDTVPQRKFSTEVAKGNQHIPLYKDSGQFSANTENYLDLNSHRYSQENIQDTTWLQTNELQRTALSKDPIRYMHPIDCPCLRCCSQERYYSAQLPPRVGYNNEELSMANFRQDTLRSYRSASSSPQYYTAVESSVYNQDTKSNDQWSENYEVEKFHQIAKRYFQPIAGGAPLIACYCCTEMLQVPADFLLPRRKCHRLKCGVCSEVLEFSLENKIHVVRYNPIPTAPPPSEFSRNYSTGDNFSVTPAVEKLPDHIRMSSSNSFGTEKEGNRKSKNVKESVKKYKNSMERFESAESSSKMPEQQSSSSEIEVESPFSGAALHKLMGYSSISRLIYE